MVESGDSAPALVCEELWDHSEEAVKDIRSHHKKRRYKPTVTLALGTVSEHTAHYDQRVNQRKRSL